MPSRTRSAGVCTGGRGGFGPARVGPVGFALVLAITVAPAAAQTADGADARAATRGVAAPAQEVPSGSRSFWGAVAGRASHRSRLVVGFWALHPYEPQFPEVEWTRGFGAARGQFVVATFINSYDERSFIGGVERYWASARRSAAEVGIGYRVGLVTGYDERLVSWAEGLPALPFAGVVGFVDVGPLAVDVYYVYRAISLETSVRF